MKVFVRSVPGSDRPTKVRVAENGPEFRLLERRPRVPVLGGHEGVLLGTLNRRDSWWVRADWVQCTPV